MLAFETQSCRCAGPLDLAGLTADAAADRDREREVRPVARPHRASLGRRPAGRHRGRAGIRKRPVRRSERRDASARGSIRLLEAAAADASRPLGALPILDDAERDTILRLWNDTAQPVPPATLPELFAQQAARTPDAIAVMFEGRTLSYAALDAHANRLAHHLRGLGVGPETMVGLCVERSPEMVIGLLGILKAGGAYLPLDPNYPRERLAFMLADAGAPVLVTQAALLEHAARARPAPAWCGSMPTGRRSRGSPTPRRRSASIRATRPTSSTPRARPAPQRASSSSMRASPTRCWRCGTSFDVGADFRSALFISSSFDASIEQTLLPFMGGGAAVDHQRRRARVAVGILAPA